MIDYSKKLENQMKQDQLASEVVLDNYGIQYIFHMTHIDNLENILRHGLLAHGNPHQQKDISDCDVNNRRARLEPFYHKPIHSYVPFYFNPRNPMLYYRKDIQDDIVILVLKRELMLTEKCIFTDGNASADHTVFADEVDDLPFIDWECVHGKYWNDFPDGKRKKMAEVLVPNMVSIDNIEGILCNNPKTKKRIDAITKERFESLVKPDFYF